MESCMQIKPYIAINNQPLLILGLGNSVLQQTLILLKEQHYNLPGISVHGQVSCQDINADI